MKKMRWLIGCESSGVVRDAILKAGHYAISCDILPSESDFGDHHQGCIIEALSPGGRFYGENFDGMICFPTCTYITTAAEWAYQDIPMINGKVKRINPGTLIGQERRDAREEALKFVDFLWNQKQFEFICLENPKGVIPTRRPNMAKPQYVQQYWFGKDASKTTGLWLKGLPPLVPENRISPRIVFYNGKLRNRWANQTNSGQNNLGPSKDRWKIRSGTPPGLGEAFVNQWIGPMSFKKAA